MGKVSAEARQLYRRSNALYDSLIAACRPGSFTRALLAAYESAGEPIPPMPVAHGLGLGFDPPVVSEMLSAAAEHEQLEPGMVLAVTGYVWQRGIGAVCRQDTVLVADDGPEVLSISPSWCDSTMAASRRPRPMP